MTWKISKSYSKRKNKPLNRKLYTFRGKLRKKQKIYIIISSKKSEKFHTYLTNRKYMLFLMEKRMLFQYIDRNERVEKGSHLNFGRNITPSDTQSCSFCKFLEFMSSQLLMKLIFSSSKCISKEKLIMYCLMTLAMWTSVFL